MPQTSATPLQREHDLRETLMGLGDPSTFLTNYLIEAGAGAGKSYTMSNSIVNLLLAEPVICKPEQLVAITFTKKATQELQSKLENAFRNRAAAARRKSCKSWPTAWIRFRSAPSTASAASC